jgi:TonB family protein
MKSTRISLALTLIGVTAIAVPAVPCQDTGKTSSSAQTVPNSNGIYRVGNGVTSPRVLHSDDPQYTEEASKKKITGTCVLEFVVDTNGIPRDVRVTKSISEGLKPKLKKIAEGLDRNAVEAVTRYRFAPAEYQGKAVPVYTSAEVSFNVY